MKVDQLIDILSQTLIAALRRSATLSEADLSEILLCALDLRIKTRLTDSALRQLANSGPTVPTSETLFWAIRRQFVFLRYDVYQEERRRFIDHWLNEERFRGQDVVTIDFLVALALEQFHFVAPQLCEYIRTWHLRHTDIRSTRTRAWMPYCLRLAGFEEAAHQRANVLLAERQKNGSWDFDLPRTVACAYALALFLRPHTPALQDTITFICERYARGYAQPNLILCAQTLKLFAVLGMIHDGHLQLFQKKLSSKASVFLSHNNRDKPFVRRLSADLQAAGFQPWTDEAEIAPGDSIIRKVEEGLEGADYLVVVLSTNSVQSNWVHKELGVGLMDALAERHIVVVPVLLEDCRIPTLLRDIRWADFRLSYDAGLEELMRTLNRTAEAS